MDNTPPTSQINGRIFLSEAYDQAYGLFDHDNDAIWNPLSMVAMHPGEDVDTTSELYSTVRRFSKYGITKRFGLSITEFLAYPRDMVSLMFETASKEIVNETAGLDDLEDKLEGG